MIWFLENIPRLQEERASINALLQEVDWLLSANWGWVEEGKLYIDCDILIGERVFPVRMLYPFLFPAIPPTIKPRGEGQHWSTHQYGYGGELCLEWGPDTWEENICGADLIRNAYKLLLLESNSASFDTPILIPSRHKLDLGQVIRRSSFRFILNSTARNYLQELSIGSTGTVNFGLIFSQGVITAFVLNVEANNREKWINQNFPSKFEDHVTNHKGILLRTNTDEKFLEQSNPTIILHKYGFDVVNKSDTEYLLILISDSTFGEYLFLRTDNDEYFQIPFN